MPSSIVFAAPADAELRPAPIPPHWIIEGTPQAQSKRLLTSADGTFSVVAWSCTPGRFNWHYTVDETLHVIGGEVFVADANGESHRLGPGDVAFFPAGSTRLWHVTKEMRKLAFCRQSMPRPLGFALRVWNKLGSILGGFFSLFAADGGPLENNPVVPVDSQRAAAS